MAKVLYEQVEKAIDLLTGEQVLVYGMETIEWDEYAEMAYLVGPLTDKVKVHGPHRWPNELEFTKE